MINNTPPANDLTLIIVTCSSYEDVLSLLIEKLKKQSGLLGSFNRVIIATDEHQSYNFGSSFKYEIVHEKDWGARVRKAALISKTKKCMLVFDDYIPKEEINTSLILSLSQSMGNNIDCIYLSSVFSSLKLIESKNISGYGLIPRNSLYRVNTTVAIWNMISLLEVLSDKDSPWEWEAFAGYKRIAREMIFYAPVHKNHQGYKYTHDTGGCVYRGNWVYDSLSACGLSNGDISKLGERPVIYETKESRRPILWKLKFLLTGFKMIGFKIFFFIFDSIKSKRNKYRNSK